MPRKQDPEADEGGAGADEETASDSIVSAISNLSEKSRQTREGALGSIANILESQHDENLREEIVSRLGDMFEGCLACLRKGADTEAIAACRALNTLIISAADDADDWLADVDNTVAPILTNGSRPELQAAVAGTLTVATFLLEMDDKGTAISCNQLLAVLCGTHASSEQIVVKAAMEGIITLLTTIPECDVIGTWGPRLLPVCTAWLGCDNVELRASAGRLAALIIGTRLEAEKAMNDGDGDGDDDALMEALAVSDEFDDAELKALVQRLATSGATHLSKKDKSEQRSVMREVAATVECNDSSEYEGPSESLLIKGEKLEFEGWRHLTMLEFFRKHVGSGLHQHIVNNPILANVLDLPDMSFEVERMTKMEKKLRAQDREDNTKDWKTSRAKGRYMARRARTGSESIIGKAGDD